MSRLQPLPLTSPFVNKEGNLTPLYRSFFDALYKKYGSTLGDLKIESNSIVNISDDGDIRLEASSVVLNNLIIDSEYDEDQALASVDNTLTSTPLEDVGLVSYTGFIRAVLATTAPDGWVLLNEGTIGNGSSGATTRANADTQDLFELLWNNISDTYCPVSSGRGATATADFNAGKTIALPIIKGRAIGVYGTGTGLTSRNLGQTVGAETHTLTASELAQHNHSSTYAIAGTKELGGFGLTSGTSTVNNGGTSVTSAATGSGQAHNNMQPTVFLNWIIKL